MRSLEVKKALAQGLQFCHFRVGPRQRLVQLLAPMRADRLVRACEVDGSDFVNLFYGQAECAQATNHVYAP